jgi:hypothetical protein
MKYRVLCLLGLACILAACGGGPNSDQPPPIKNRPKVATAVVVQPTVRSLPSNNTNSAKPATTNAKTINVKAELWADNWFALYLDNKLIKEDSVPLTTERSFNAETVTFPATYPMRFNVVLKDYIQNDTGLEYIGTDRQQIGDGGFIGQFTNADTGATIGVTNEWWKCTVIHTAPLDNACAAEANPIAGQGACGFTALPEPTDWKSPTFDTNSWLAASLYSAAQVSPKEGYDTITWKPEAKFIWGPDLKTNNTVLCSVTVYKP